MDNLRAVIKNLFCNISPYEIISGRAHYDNIKEDIFRKLGNGYIEQYTNNEIRNMYHFMEYEFYWQDHRIRGELPQRAEEHKINVFEALLAFNYQVLLEERGEPLCQYQHLLRWREMTIEIEEDIFITSFFAMQDILKNVQPRKNFFWKPVIGHNNLALNRLLAQGVAENHFHLKGSAPLFHLSWISFMNHVTTEQFVRYFKEYDKHHLKTHLNYNMTLAKDSYVYMWYGAAWIRLFLFADLRGESVIFDKNYVEINSLIDLCKPEKRTDLKKKLGRLGKLPDEMVNIEEYRDYVSDEDMKIIRKKYAERMLSRMMNDTREMEQNLSVLQNNIERLGELNKRFHHEEPRYDYAICESWLYKNADNGKNEVISGERWFLYSMFSKAYRQEKRDEKYINWFYLYLVLKTRIRMEMIQANKTYGFDNFREYQDRKDLFVEGTEYEKIFIRMAVRDTILNQHIKFLEARITPKNTAVEMQKTISRYDSWICSKTDEKIEEKFFYVVHFIKELDKYPVKGECRHYKKRNAVEAQARAIAEMRDLKMPESRRIHGIDASSTEIGCRPEVFAQAFRYLKQHENCQTYVNGIVSEGLWKSEKLMATYHVGEDFLDIVDGLRAIDEAILFLNLKCGDRLGHALALGVDIDEWYQLKGSRILLPKQDYLDNLVWLYNKIRKYSITDCAEAVIYIEKRFNDYFGEIYVNNLISEECENMRKLAEEYFDGKGVLHGYHHQLVKFGLNEYYDAWKLRGDNPELYRMGFFKQNCVKTDDWQYCAANRDFPQNYKIRYNPETALLYHMYHYNEEVKKLGSQIVEIKVKQCLIDAVKKVREKMQQDVARMGIAIETNPSSNYLIGTFRRYDKHPIIQWYNEGLTYDLQALMNCPQIQVSINTDDQGVFSTYIENEYAYLALALEKAKDKDGNYLYNRTAILHWLDNVRVMGLKQSFNLNDMT